jgi:excisionase family DNA binding protein
MAKKESPDMDELISIAEAARLRGVSHTAIRDLIDRGRLTAQVIAGRRVLRRGDVVGFKQASKGGRPRKDS